MSLSLTSLLTKNILSDDTEWDEASVIVRLIIYHPGRFKMQNQKQICISFNVFVGLVFISAF